MRKVQGAGFGVRFYRRGTVKTTTVTKSMPKEEAVMKQEMLIQTRIPDASRRLWESTWTDIQMRQEKPAPAKMPAPLAIFAKSVSEAARLIQKESKPTAADEAFPVTDEPSKDDKDMLKEIAAMAKAAYEKALYTKLESKEDLLWAAARVGDCSKIRTLVMQGVDIDARDAHGRTAINIAAQYNQQQAMKTLLAAKEMRYMAKLGDLPDTKFFRKFQKTGS